MGDKCKSRMNSEDKAALAGGKPSEAPICLMLKPSQRYHMLVTDLDNTLLDEDKKACEADKAAIGRLIDAGYLFTIATGRGPLSASRYFNELGANAPAIIFNGARIVDFSAGGKVIFNSNMKREPAIRAIKHAKDMGITVIAFGGESCLADKDDKWRHFYENATSTECLLVDNLADYVASMPAGIELTKLILFSEPSKRDAIVDVFKLGFPEFSIVGTTPHYSEILPLGISKGFALKKLAKYLGIETEIIVTVGDAPNDIEMIQCSGLGAAVANADDIVKSKAQIVVGKAGSGGIAELISLVFGI